MDVQTVNLIINSVGFVVLGSIIIALTKRLKTQSEMLSEHNKMFEGVKAFLEFTNPEALIKMADNIVALNKKEMEEERKKEQRELREQFEKDLHKKKLNEKMLFNEILSATSLIAGLIYYVRPEDRQVAIADAKEGQLKDFISKDIEKAPYVYESLYNALQRFAPREPKPKGLLDERIGLSGSWTKKSEEGEDT